MATEEMKKKKKVMVAIDESECSHYALEWALDNLRDSIISSPSSASAAEEERTLIVYTAQPLTNLSYLTAASYGSARTFSISTPELIRSLQDNQKKIALALLEQAKEICAKRGVYTFLTLFFLNSSICIFR
ncbi:hypothetical protein QJS10_CPA01g01487 [Acorus calamus]|uniref:UspA domain-containing protein n=1 Tax=Acorus calamus TaxID=4465 RepID=A0AAV9FQP6_ACOCL|nr:hypothetical protein QJS10_CPA01g01487 [Acorus calamus]